MSMAVLTIIFAIVIMLIGHNGGIESCQTIKILSIVILVVGTITALGTLFVFIRKQHSNAHATHGKDD